MQSNTNQNDVSIWDNAIVVVGKVLDWFGDLFRKKHYVLLTGCSHAGKTEAYFALKDITEQDIHPNHADRDTIAVRTYPPIRLGGKLLALSDGPGSRSRETQYKQFFETAKDNIAVSSIVYFFDLARSDSFWHSASEKATLQKEFAQLNRLASSTIPENKGKYRIIIVGSHKDCFTFDRNLKKASNEMREKLSCWIDQERFRIIDFIEADLKSDDGARKFMQNLMQMLDSSNED